MFSLLGDLSQKYLLSCPASCKSSSDTGFLSYLLGYSLLLFSNKVVSEILANTLGEIRLLFYSQPWESEFILCDRNYSFFTVAHRTLAVFEIWRRQGEDDISGSQSCRSKQDLWHWQVVKKEGGSVNELWGSRVMVQVISVNIKSSVMWVTGKFEATNRGSHILLVICVIWFSVFQLNSLSKFKEKIWNVTQKEWCWLWCSNWIFALS